MGRHRGVGRNARVVYAASGRLGAPGGGLPAGSLTTAGGQIDARRTRSASSPAPLTAQALPCALLGVSPSETVGHASGVGPT
jgi:hypothetical protein